jgi:acyl carrier protein
MTSDADFGYARAKGPVAVPATSGLAIASLVLGILGWFILPVIGSISAIVLGHMARGEIRRSDGRVEGKGLATAGLVLGYVGLVVFLLVMLLVISLVGVVAYTASQSGTNVTVASQVGVSSGPPIPAPVVSSWVLSIVADQSKLSRSGIQLSTKLADLSGGVDKAVLATVVEKKFAIKFEPQEIEGWETVEDVINSVKAKQPTGNLDAPPPQSGPAPTKSKLG